MRRHVPPYEQQNRKTASRVVVAGSVANHYERFMTPMA